MVYNLLSFSCVSTFTASIINWSKQDINDCEPPPYLIVGIVFMILFMNADIHKPSRFVLKVLVPI